MFIVMRKNFGLFSATKLVEVKDRSLDYKGSILESERNLPNVIEGTELIDTLCPVSKNTGRRENPLSLLGKLTGAESSLLNSVLQELPTLRSDPRLTDEDRVAAVVDRLSTGSPAEDALMAERLMKDIDALGLSSKVAEDVKSDASDTIKFDVSEVPANPE